VLAILQWRRDSNTRRFAVWMAVGAAFVLGLLAGNFPVAPTPISWSGWLEIAGLFLLTILFVFAGTQRDDAHQSS